MRLTDLFENEKEKKFLQFWASVEGGYRRRYTGHEMGRIQSIAKSAYMDGRQIEPQDAIGYAREIVQGERDERAEKASAQQKAQPQTKQAPQKPARDRVKPTVTKGDPNRVSKSGKKWGNQYYSDPAQADGIKGAFAKNRPGALAKRAVAKANQVAGDAMDITKLPGNISNLNPRNRRK